MAQKFITLLYISAFLMVFAPAGYAQGQTQFFDTLYDIPLMAGMEEVSEAALSFDKPEGRISQASAVSRGASEAEILAFYQKTLPQMGWQDVSPARYVREGEMLDIEIEGAQGVDNKQLIVNFSLNPVP